MPRTVSSILWAFVGRLSGWRWIGKGAVLGLGLVIGGSGLAQAQQRIGHVDTEYILNQMPEYATVQQKLDQLERRWRKEIEKQEQRVDELEKEFEAREVLYTEAERQRQQKAIAAAKEKVERLRQQYFGPDGDLYTRQQELMRPLQERILEAAERVASSAGYDYILDKKGDTLFLFARDDHSLSDRVLQELGINVDQAEGQE